jgi:hypothetical protein
VRRPLEEQLLRLRVGQLLRCRHVASLTYTAIRGGAWRRGGPPSNAGSEGSPEPWFLGRSRTALQIDGDGRPSHATDRSSGGEPRGESARLRGDALRPARPVLRPALRHANDVDGFPLDVLAAVALTAPPDPCDRTVPDSEQVLDRDLLIPVCGVIRSNASAKPSIPLIGPDPRP